MSALDLDPTVIRELFDYRDGGLYWRASPSNNVPAGRRFGCLDAAGRRVGSVLNQQCKEHQLVWAWHHRRWPEGVVDHINGLNGYNGEPPDNRIENLRDATRAVNAQNQRRPTRKNTSGALGVKLPHGQGRRLTAAIKVDGVTRHLGSFDTVEDAQQAYLTAKRRLHEGCTL